MAMEKTDSKKLKERVKRQNADPTVPSTNNSTNTSTNTSNTSTSTSANTSTNTNTTTSTSTTSDPAPTPAGVGGGAEIGGVSEDEEVEGGSSAKGLLARSASGEGVWRGYGFLMKARPGQKMSVEEQSLFGA
ncbi:hypothetical protein OF83DRAFT_1174373 [Amylostereum chailletii]|nr:hypothetical protein OF83DRAFT_1174373 [Amylostereum chailletii]